MKFSYVCDLFESLETLELSHIPLQKQKKEEQSRDILQRWFHNHRRLIEDQSALLSCLLPEQRVDRVYSMRRKRVSITLSKCLGLSMDASRRLRDAPEGSDLASMAHDIVRERGGGFGHNPVTIQQIDKCLADLAAISRFSSARVRQAINDDNPHNQEKILGSILKRLMAREIKWFVRILCKNLNPVQLKPNNVLHKVHPHLPAMLKVRANFEDALELLQDHRLRQFERVEGIDLDNIPRSALDEYFRPRIGAKVGRPLFLKARSFRHAAKLVAKRRWSVEPKLDGEYCQVHVDLTKTKGSIQLFSKSGKDSTEDRQKVHGWIRHALRLNKDCRFNKKCILEGELVVVDIRDNRILGFEKIRKHVTRSGSFLGAEQDSETHSHEQLRILFFDILLIDEEVLIHQPYEKRRERLQQTIPHSHGSTTRAQWGYIDFASCSPKEAMMRLIKNWRKAHAARDEGLILKPLDGAYLSMNPRENGNYDGTMIKLKADYIPGLGDSADFAVIGAYSSDDHKVEPELHRQTRWTQFVVACLLNKDDVSLRHSRPNFRVMGSISRPGISAEDMRYLSQHGQFREARPLEYDIEPSNNDGMLKTLFGRPFIVELVGSRFEKPANTSHWMLRHPRVIKLHNDRAVEEVVSFEELQVMAKESLEVPQDQVKEQTKIMEQIRKTQEMVRSRYVDEASPFSRTTTMSTSPGSTRPSKTLQAPLVRMDSCEMQNGDQRFVSPISEQPQREEKNSDLPCTLPGRKTKTQALVGLGNSRLQHGDTRLISPTRAKLSCGEHPLDLSKAALVERPQRGKLELTNELMVNGLDPSPSLSLTKVSDVYQRRHHPLKPQSGSDSNRKRKGELLSDITPPKRRLLARSKSAGDTPGKQMVGPSNLSHYVPNPPAKSTPRPSDLLVQKLRKSKSFSTIGQLQKAHGVRSSTSFLSGIPHGIVSRPLPGRLKHDSPLQQCVFMLAPGIAREDWVRQDLLPLFKPLDISTNLKHWSRQRLPNMDKKSGPEVEDSQAFEGCAKIALVNSYDMQSAETFVNQLMKIRLGEDEVIHVWDWRALHELVQSESNACSNCRWSSARIATHQCELREHFRGTLRLTTEDERETINSAGLTRAKLSLSSLSNAVGHVTVESEMPEETPAGPPVNVFLQPGQAGLEDQVLKWEERLWSVT